MKGKNILNGTRLSTPTKFNAHFSGYGYFLPVGGFAEPLLLAQFRHLATLPGSDYRHRFGRFNTYHLSCMEIL